MRPKRTIIGKSNGFARGLTSDGLPFVRSDDAKVPPAAPPTLGFK